MLEQFGAVALVQFHDDMLGSTAWPGQPAATVPPEVWRWVEANHRFNCLAWEEEGKAVCASSGMSAAASAASKRLIERYQQRRLDAVERIDEALLAQLAPVPPLPEARLSSETAGAMIDRLSLLALRIVHSKIVHRQLQAQADGATGAHAALCMDRITALETQRGDLASCLDRLLGEAGEGRAYFKLYRQFTMAGDLGANPYLYARAGRAVQAGAGPW